MQIAEVKEQAKPMPLDAQVRYVEDEIRAVMDKYTK